MTRLLKLLAYHVARVLGLFRLARRITRKRLRILAYHGFAEGDALQFRPKLFISPGTFRSRLSLLRRRGFRVLALDDAIAALRSGQPPENAVVITIDDGYAATATVAAPLLQEFGFPATVYVTTYHVVTQTPVFDLVVGYMLWRSDRQSAILSEEGALPGLYLDLSTPAAREDALRRVIAAGRAMASEVDRVALCRRLGEACAVSYDDIVRRGDFQLMTPEAIGTLGRYGISVGLHTHRHRFPPDDLTVCERELADNAEHLSRWCAGPSPHFCYPSGVYTPAQWPLLERLGIRSSTTCETGLVCAGDPPHGLRRFLDGEMVSSIEFDAEVCGFAELLRQWAGGWRVAGREQVS
jgi:peptidoglycan/xylan/chitin deacetylase (PgdA/CDA1 family)